MLEKVADMRFPDSTVARIQHLMELNNDGQLFESRQAELELYSSTKQTT